MQRLCASFKGTEPPVGDPPPQDPTPQPGAPGLASLCAALALAGALAVLTGCSLELPGGGDNTTQVQTVNVNPTGPTAPGASPSPSGGSCPGAAIIAQVRVNPFGYDCPDGTPKPNNSSGLLPVGCTAAVTATPKRADGTDVPADLHGTEITWTVVTGSEFITVTSDPNEAFNKNVFGKAGPGEFMLQATVCGKSGAWVGRTTVEGASGLDYDPMAMRAELTIEDFMVKPSALRSSGRYSRRE